MPYIIGSDETDSVLINQSIRSIGLALNHLPKHKFAELPAAGSTNADGMIAYVTDSTTAVWGATVAGGGANVVLVWSNGTNWTVVGK
jgi:hypothetical protein